MGRGGGIFLTELNLRLPERKKKINIYIYKEIRFYSDAIYPFSAVELMQTGYANNCLKNNFLFSFCLYFCLCVRAKLM